MKQAASGSLWVWADKHPRLFLIALICSIPLADLYRTTIHPEQKESYAKLDAVKSRVEDLNAHFNAFMLSDSLNRKDTDRRINRLENRPYYRAQSTRVNSPQNQNHNQNTARR